jgi:hypothetical protein
VTPLLTDGPTMGLSLDPDVVRPLLAAEADARNRSQAVSDAFGSGHPPDQ